MALSEVSVSLLRQSAGQAVPSLARNNAALTLFLADGGDERIKPDPLTGRTKYGTPANPAPDEIWFSSSTASAVDPRGFAAASDALLALVGEGHFVHPLAWFDALRERIAGLFGIPGSEAVLAGSGTEAEFLALSIARARAKRPLTSIVVAPTETGSGVMRAATGRHFLASASLEGVVAAGTCLDGLECEEIAIETIAVRDPSGAPRPAYEIDKEAAGRTAQALAAGRDVLLHVVDTSKTGLGGVTRRMAQSIAKGAGGRVQIVVDACQLRCAPQVLQSDLKAGFMVMITGSKFAAGPPFAGAILLPPGLAEDLGGRGPAPAGLKSYSALLDWPQALRQNFARTLDVPFNLGLGLRWEAALATIEAFFALPDNGRAHICAWFAAEVQRLVAARPHLRLAQTRPGATVFPVVTRGAETPAAAHALYKALAEETGVPAELSRRCHVGQPVAVGSEAALRICASMPLVLDIADHMAEGRAIESAPAAGDLDFLFRKWDVLAGC